MSLSGPFRRIDRVAASTRARERQISQDDDLGEFLRAAIISSDRSVSAIAKDSGVNPGLISRFMTGHDLRLETATKIARTLGLRLVKCR